MDQPLSDGSDTTFADTLQAPRTDDSEASVDDPSEAASLLASLEPEQRLILSLRELEGRSYEELADILNCHVNTIKSRLNRAREALKSAYVRLYGNIPDSKIVLESREKP